MVVANQKAARNEVMAHFYDAWTGNVTSQDIDIIWVNANSALPPKPESTSEAEAAPWARVSMQHNSGGQVTLSNDGGSVRWERIGIITVEIYTPVGTGFDKLHDDLVQIAVDAFEGESTPSDVVFYRVFPREVGQDGPWFRSDVLIEFRYDEIK